MSSIKEFYKNEHILITGGTGFVGKLLISKLFLSCPQIKRITLLIRRKGNSDVNNRVKSLFNDEIFSTLKKQVPTFQERIDVIEGDCEKKHLDLSQVDRFLITQSVTIVFHCAANVEFNKDLKNAIKSNVYSAYEVIKVVKHLRNLKAFVYVSSSYSNCHHPVVEESHYKMNINYKTLLSFANSDNLEVNEKQILGDIATTYFYTKAAAEQTIHEEGKGLPIAIFRPSAIISTWKEPIPGWTDKAFAPTALAKSIILGRSSSMLCTDTLNLDMVPGDLTINALIAVAWDVHSRWVNNNLVVPRVYNYVSMVDNPLKFKRFLETIMKMIYQKPSQQAVWYPQLILDTTRFKNRIRSLLRPWLLAYLVEWKIRLFNSKSRSLLKACKIHEVLMDVTDSVIKNPHVYVNDNVKELWDDMNEVDQKLFAFDIKQIDWDVFIPIYYEGILRYLLREEKRDEEKAHKHLVKLRTIHYTFTAIVYSFLLLLIYKLFIIFS